MLDAPLNTFAVVRPYDDAFRRQVVRVLHGLQYAPVALCEPKTSDDDAVAFLRDQNPLPDLVLMPFHEHTSHDGAAIDGLNVFLRLPEAYVDRGVRVVMPVSDFAWNSKFARRQQEVLSQRPELERLLVPVPPAQLNAAFLSGALGQPTR